MDRKVFILKIGIDNLIVSIAMTITASLISTVWDMYTLICIPMTFILTFTSSLIIPFGKIINWFSSLFRIKPNTVASTLVRNLLINIYFTTLASLSCKLLIFKDFALAFNVFIETFLVMYVVSYFVYVGTYYLTNYLLKKYCDNKNA